VAPCPLHVVTHLKLLCGLDLHPQCYQVNAPFTANPLIISTVDLVVAIGHKLPADSNPHTVVIEANPLCIAPGFVHQTAFHHVDTRLAVFDSSAEACAFRKVSVNHGLEQALQFCAMPSCLPICFVACPRSFLGLFWEAGLFVAFPPEPRQAITLHFGCMNEVRQPASIRDVAIAHPGREGIVIRLNWRRPIFVDPIQLHQPNYVEIDVVDEKVAAMCLP
jgi:hypothetical protein